MTLSEYMKLADFTDQKLADEVGVNRSTITRLRLGTRKPTFEQIEKLHAVTKGAVTFLDFSKPQGGAA